MIEDFLKAALALSQKEDHYRDLTRKKYEKLLNRMRSNLAKTQFRLQESSRPVILVITGMDGAGKGEIITLINEWLDPRLLDTHSFWRLSEEADQRPRYWRYWRALPTRGHISIWFGGWYEPLLMEGISAARSRSGLDDEMEHIRHQERMLCEDGALILKFWFHLSKTEQRQRLEHLHRKDKPNWRAMEDDWSRHRIYPLMSEVTGHILERTSSPPTPWYAIPSADRLQRNLMLADILDRSLEEVVREKNGKRIPASKSDYQPSGRNILDKVDLTRALSQDEYRSLLIEEQSRLHKLFWEACRREISTILVFEGWDASGKGGAIRRVTAAIDPRLYRIVQTGPPTTEEHGYHYLWRFWRDLPRDGRITIFDRSWYGRVLVERVEGFATTGEWQRAYSEINRFEREIRRHGTVLLKFWLHISQDKQMQRFRSRQQTPHKQHKITEEDWRNRERWKDYEAAVNDMIALTGTPGAPWTLIAGNNKRYARIQTIRTICRALETALGSDQGRSVGD